MKQPEQIITYDSPEAASIKTVTGWVSRTGRFWGSDEHMARYDGCTHRKCDGCGKLYRSNGYCEPCYEEKDAERYAAMPLVTWNGSDCLYSRTHEEWFMCMSDIDDFCASNDCTPEELELIICTPNFPCEIDPNEHFCDELLEDAEVPPDIAEAFDVLNSVIRAHRARGIPFSWSVGKTRPTPESLGGGA